jgi:hypothetical protein
MGVVACAGLVSDPAWAVDTEEVLGIALGGLVFGTDASFAIYDVYLAAEERPPVAGATIAETVVGVPQAAIGHGAIVFMSQERGDDEVKLILPGATMLATALMIHGAWGTFERDVSPTTLFFAPSLLAIDLTFTNVAISNGIGRSMPVVATSIMELGATIPATAAGIALAIEEPGSRPMWISLASWSGALVVHASAWLLLGEDDDDTSVASSAPPLALTPTVSGCTSRERAPTPVSPSAHDDCTAGLTLSGAF